MRWHMEHLGLAARDPVALRDWYADKLGASLLRQLQRSPPAFMLTLPGGALLEIYAAQGFVEAVRDNQTAGWRHVALAVDSIDTARAKLEAKGVEIIDPVKPAGGGGRVLFFRDGEGNLLHLVERPSEFTWAAPA